MPNAPSPICSRKISLEQTIYIFHNAKHSFANLLQKDQPGTNNIYISQCRMLPRQSAPEKSAWNKQYIYFTMPNAPSPICSRKISLGQTIYIFHNAECSLANLLQKNQPGTNNIYISQCQTLLRQSAPEKSAWNKQQQHTHTYVLKHRFVSSLTLDKTLSRTK